MEGSTAGNSQIPQHILDDLCARFVINLPEEESRDPIRIFFQIELAHWFYKDFYCPEYPELRQCGIKDFATQIFQHCPSLAKHVGNFDSILESWKEYKMTVPTYGAILLDPSLEYCLLVQGYWVKASWGFPKGKVNQDESPIDCAIREVLEETGFDITNLISEDKYIEKKINGQTIGLYVVSGVSMGTEFKARTRNEIKSFEWFRVDSLPSHKRDGTCKQTTGLNPNSFFMVIPFIKMLRQHVSRKQNMTTAAGTPSAVYVESGPSTSHEVTVPSGAVWNASSSRDSKGRQKQQFAQQMQLEYNEYIGGNEQSKRSSSTSTSIGGGGGGRLQPSLLSSPNKMHASYPQIQILKRDDSSKQMMKTEDACTGINRTDAVAMAKSATDSGSSVLIEPAVWTNFRLDCDAVLSAMFPSLSTDSQNRRGRSKSIRTA